MLDFEHTNMCEIAYYGEGYRVKALPDECADNPFESWDDHFPMHVHLGRDGNRTYNDPQGICLAPLNLFSANQIVRYQKAIAKIIGDEGAYYEYPSTDILSDMQSYMRDNKPYMGRNNRADYIKSYLGEALSSLPENDKMDAIAAILAIVGISAIYTSSQGYCQGDYATILIVAPPYFVKEHYGKKIDKSRIIESMESQARLFGYWAWGDCYGFVAEKLANDGDPDCDDDWQDIDSCWGFYGPHDESGLTHAAMESILFDMKESKNDI